MNGLYLKTDGSGRSAGHWKLLLKASFQWPGARGIANRSDGAATLAITGQAWSTRSGSPAPSTAIRQSLA